MEHYKTDEINLRIARKLGETYWEAETFCPQKGSVLMSADRKVYLDESLAKAQIGNRRLRIVKAPCEVSPRDYRRDHTAIHIALHRFGVFNRDNTDLRVKWVNRLRSLVDKRMPKNKSGSPLTTDIDMFSATAEEHADALLYVMYPPEPKAKAKPAKVEETPLLCGF